METFLLLAYYKKKTLNLFPIYVITYYKNNLNRYFEQPSAFETSKV